MAEDPAGEERARVGRQVPGEVRLDDVAEFVAGGEGDPGAASRGGLQPREAGGPVGGRVADDFLDEIGEQPGTG